MQYIPDRDCPVDQEALLGRLREALWDECEITLKPTDVVQPAPSGKYRLVASTSYEGYRCVAPEKRSAPLGEYW